MTAMTNDTGETVPIAEFAREVGREIGCSRWFVVDQDRIDRFADAIEDRYFLHVDPERARVDSPFGGTIAHGFLSLSLLSAMAGDVQPEFREPAISINYGLDRVRFLSPVPAGKRVRGRFTLAEMSERKPGQYLLRYHVIVEIEGSGRPALFAEWLAMQMIHNGSE